MGILQDRVPSNLARTAGESIGHALMPAIVRCYGAIPFGDAARVANRRTLRQPLCGTIAPSAKVSGLGVAVAVGVIACRMEPIRVSRAAQFAPSEPRHGRQ
jgi:hypothetical protein